MVLDSLLKSCNHISNVTVYDQNPINRKEIFSSYKRVSYNHIFWDWQTSPVVYKAAGVNGFESEYTAIISDDVLMKPGWFEAASQIIDSAGPQSMISGFGKTSFFIKDLFTLGVLSEVSAEFNITKVVDPTFIFGKSADLGLIKYPKEIKYFGEAELLSFESFLIKLKIFSMPSSFYENLNQKTLENKYKTFSLYHGYNRIFEVISQDFWQYLGYEACPIKRLPYNPNDVYYNPNQTQFDQIDGRKFLSGIKAIY